jgi:hypothetical protein
MSRLCRLGYGNRNVPGSWLWRCEEPATVVITQGCEHEHVVPSVMCEEHAAEAERGGYHCSACWDSAQSHACPVIIRREAAVP